MAEINNMQPTEFEELDKMFETGFNEAVKHILSFLKGELSEDELNLLLKDLDLKIGKDIKQFISQHFLPKSILKEKFAELPRITVDAVPEDEVCEMIEEESKDGNYIRYDDLKSVLKDLDL